MLLAGGAGLSVSFGLLAAIIGPLVAAFALAWAMSRTQALSAWRSAAEGYQMQVAEVTTRLSNTEEQARELHAEVTRLMARPDYTIVSKQLERVLGMCVEIQETAVDVKGTADEIKGAVDALDQRWG